MEDLSTEPVAERASSAFNPFNILAVIFLILSCLSALCVGVVFASPGLVPAPLRAPTEVELITLRPRSPDFTPTNTSIVSTLPPEWTATHTPTVTLTPTQSQTPSDTPTGTLRPTSTSTATITPTPSRTPTSTPTGPTPTPSRTRSAFQFTMQNDQPSYIQNFANTAGCNWMGIAGQAFDLRSSPMQGLIVHLEGGGLNYDVFTGDPRFSAYGPGGYELYIGNKAADTTDLYRVQLRNQTGQPLSAEFVIRTFADCRRNLILVNFVQNH